MIKHRGYSMLETIIYIGILTLIIAVLVTFLFNILSRQSKINTMLEVDQNARFALDRIAGVIRNAKEATTPADGIVGSILTMTMADAAISPTVFTVTNGVLTMQQGTGAAVPLTSSYVAVTSLNFRNLLDPIYHLRTEPVAMTCQSNPNKRLICHGGNTQCVSKNAKLAEGDMLGPCWVTTSAKSTIRIEMTVASPPAPGAGNEYQSSETLYDTITIPRQN